MPKAGLEPAQISPYAPETYVSTIPPLRHSKNITIFLLNYQRNYALSGGSFLKGNPLLERYSIVLVGRVPLRHSKNITIFLLNYQLY